MDDFRALDSFAADLVASLEPAARKELAQRLARELRASQQQRIAAQLNPDGTPYAPRKPQLRHRKGRLRAMFAKLRTARFLKAKGTPEGVLIDFTNDVQRIARVHQLGLRDRVSRKTGAEADYPARQLLGISDADEALIRDRVTAHLADRL